MGGAVPVNVHIGEVQLQAVAGLLKWLQSMFTRENNRRCFSHPSLDGTTTFSNLYRQHIKMNTNHIYTLTKTIGLLKLQNLTNKDPPIPQGQQKLKEIRFIGMVVAFVTMIRLERFLTFTYFSYFYTFICFISLSR